jgi:thiamine-phosphate pyrophosphorylase
VALGGIAPDKVALCRAAGAAGIAVMGEAMRAADPRAMIGRFVQALSAAGAS